MGPGCPRSKQGVPSSALSANSSTSTFLAFCQPLLIVVLPLFFLVLTPASHMPAYAPLENVVSSPYNVLPGPCPFPLTFPYYWLKYRSSAMIRVISLSPNPCTTGIHITPPPCSPESRDVAIPGPAFGKHCLNSCHFSLSQKLIKASRDSSPC
jgi:hypothetical protein